MKLPRLKLRKNTRATLGGLAIAVASLYALAMAYDEARDNLWRFFVGTLVMLAIISVVAVTLVALLVGIRTLWQSLTARSDKDDPAA